MLKLISWTGWTKEDWLEVLTDIVWGVWISVFGYIAVFIFLLI